MNGPDPRLDAPVEETVRPAAPGPAGKLERGVLWALLIAVSLGVMVAAWREAHKRDLTSAGLVGTGERRPLPLLSQVPDFALLDQTGSAVDRSQLAGRPWIADFVFTRCAISCPRMTSQMLRLRARLTSQVGADGRLAARLVSVTVDPAHDRPEVLAAYAAGYGITGTDWLFLTGEPTAVRSLVRDGFKLPVEDTPADATDRLAEPITHSSRFVLVDGEGMIRGYYDAFAADGLDRLLADLATLRQP